MQGAVLYAPRDVRFEEREEPKIAQPTDAIIRLSATCICGSDLWPYRGVQAIAQPTPMGHEYCGIVEEVGREVRNINPGSSSWARLRPLTTLAPSAATAINPPACIGSS
jgi:threonine dehydrogenase-like Zn-dependent dehydrogenase